MRAQVYWNRLLAFDRWNGTEYNNIMIVRITHLLNDQLDAYKRELDS